MRLSRLQRELNEKSDEIRRLQSDVMCEADENAALRQRLAEAQRRYKELEKKNQDLTHRLDEQRRLEQSVALASHGDDAQLAALK